MPSEYLNNKVLEDLIVQYQKSKNKKRLSKKEKKECEATYNLLAQFFALLSSNIVKAFHFNMIESDDMISEAVMICLARLNHFDKSRGSRAFNYYTTCILNHFRQLYRSAKNYRNLKEKYFLHLTTKEHNKFVKNASKKFYNQFGNMNDE